MKAKLYLVSALIASAGTAFAASQKPQYNEMTLPGGVSTAYSAEAWYMPTSTATATWTSS